MRPIAIFAAAAVLLAACEAEQAATPGDEAPAASAEQGSGAAAGSAGAVSDSLPGGEITQLTIVEQQTGDGAVAETGATAVVHYTGWLYDANANDRRGSQFDSSRDSGQPFSFPLGAGRVIQGWDQGVAGMRVGGRRLLFIPPELGYGARGFGTVIPPDSTLVFDVELLEVR